MPGEILAVIGDNGAGKVQPDPARPGAIQPDERARSRWRALVQFSSRLEARGEGTECVYQTLVMSPALSIADNMFMAASCAKPGIMGQWFRQLDRPAMEKFRPREVDRAGA